MVIQSTQTTATAYSENPPETGGHNVGSCRDSVDSSSNGGHLAPSAHADPAQDHQYLELVRSNGVTGGQDPALIAFAQQYCSPNPPPFLDTVGALYGQGVWASQIYILKVAASRATARIGLRPRSSRGDSRFLAPIQRLDRLS
jgi:hypothetical protein